MMTVVKRMTAKKDFLKMSLKDRNCEVELYEDCRTRKLLKECNCVPWEVPGFKVRAHPKGFKVRAHPKNVGAISSVHRISTYAAQQEETALRGTLRRVSTAVPHVKGFMLMSGRWMEI